MIGGLYVRLRQEVKGRTLIPGHYKVLAGKRRSEFEVLPYHGLDPDTGGAVILRKGRRKMN